MDWDDTRREGETVLEYRVRELGGFRKEMERWRRHVDDDRRDFRNAMNDMQTLGQAFNGLRRTLIGFAFTIAGAAVVFSLTVLTATGKL